MSVGSPPTPEQQWAAGLLLLCGAGVGLLVTHYVTLYPFRRLMATLRQMTAGELAVRVTGLCCGLLIGLLLTPPISRLPSLLGTFGPMVVALVAAYIGMAIAATHKHTVEHWFTPQAVEVPPAPIAGSHPEADRLVLDTSVIVDGRIADVVRTGWLCPHLVVPQFVLHEVQLLADSGDDLTRAKGKRGLDVLRTLQATPDILVEVSPWDQPQVRQVDDKLVAMALAEGAKLVTNDSNLEHVARLQQVRVLNLNALQEALRTPMLAGDRLRVVIRNEGREREQGIGFLGDGTMVVVEDARHLVGSEVSVVITRLYTTATGRMLFAQLDAEQPATPPTNRRIGEPRRAVGQR